MHQTSSLFSGPYTCRHDPLQDAPSRADLRLVALVSALSGSIVTAAAIFLGRFL